MGLSVGVSTVGMTTADVSCAGAAAGVAGVAGAAGGGADVTGAGVAGAAGGGLRTLTDRADDEAETAPSESVALTWTA